MLNLLSVLIVIVLLIQSSKSVKLLRGVYRPDATEAIKITYDDKGKMIVHHRGQAVDIVEMDEAEGIFTLDLSKGQKGPMMEVFNQKFFILDERTMVSKDKHWHLGVRSNKAPAKAPAPAPAEQPKPQPRPLAPVSDNYADTTPPDHVCHKFFRGCCRNSTSIPSTFTETMHSLLRKMRSKHVVLVGDSITEGFYDFLLLALQYSNIPLAHSRTVYAISSGNEYAALQNASCIFNFQIHRSEIHVAGKSTVDLCQIFSELSVPSYNVTVTFLFSYRLHVPQDYLDDSYRGQRIRDIQSLNTLHYSIFEKYTRLADSMVVNFGLHYNHFPPFVYLQTIRYVAATLVADMAANPSKRHVFRTTLPVHFTSRGRNRTLGLWEMADQGQPCSKSTTSRELSESLALQHLRDEMPSLPLLSFYELMKDRGDQHSSTERYSLDCAHWCFSPDFYSSMWSSIAAAVGGSS